MPPMPNRNVQQPNQENLWIKGLRTLSLSLFLAFGIRAGIAQSFFIPSGSMEPTLQIDDRVMVDKLSYRFKPPQRGDVVVFSPPNAATTECGLPPNSHTFFIKRVIGLPGEKLEIKEGRVYINDRPWRENYIADKPQYQWGPKILPPSSYLVLGDNRNNSCDGHTWGFVHREHIIGQAIVRFWPPNRISIFPKEQTQ